MRYIFNNSLSWSEELARYLFIWMVYLAIGYAAKQRKHIKIDAALWLFPQRIRPYICIVGDIVVLLFSAFIIKTSYELFMKSPCWGKNPPQWASQCNLYIWRPLWDSSSPFTGLYKPSGLE